MRIEFKPKVYRYFVTWELRVDGDNFRLELDGTEQLPIISELASFTGRKRLTIEAVDRTYTFWEVDELTEEDVGIVLDALENTKKFVDNFNNMVKELKPIVVENDI